MRSQTETPKRYRYTGKERDEESGLNYHRARYYAVWIARWTSNDPDIMCFKETNSTSGYSFCALNPLRFVDPTGGTVEVNTAATLPGGRKLTAQALRDIIIKSLPEEYKSLGRYIKASKDQKRLEFVNVKLVEGQGKTTVAPEWWQYLYKASSKPQKWLITTAEAVELKGSTALEIDKPKDVQLVSWFRGERLKKSPVIWDLGEGLLGGYTIPTESLAKALKGKLQVILTEMGKKKVSVAVQEKMFAVGDTGLIAIATSKREEGSKERGTNPW